MSSLSLVNHMSPCVLGFLRHAFRNSLLVKRMLRPKDDVRQLCQAVRSSPTDGVQRP